jgi:hypothetical protein
LLTFPTYFISRTLQARMLSTSYFPITLLW